MCEYEIKIVNGIAKVKSPYNPNFALKIKMMGGKWDPEAKTWNIDERNVESAREIMREVYGRDDGAAELVSVKVITTSALYGSQSPVVLFGRTIASAHGRDSGARVGDNVAFTKGSPRSGGSMKNWETVVPEGCEFIMHDMPKAAIKDISSKITVEIVGKVVIDKAALEAEKERLIARLEEIKNLLK